jgi:hypothetical protein
MHSHEIDFSVAESGAEGGKDGHFRRKAIGVRR